MKLTVLNILMVMVFFSCAKKRPVEEVQERDNNRFHKAAFLKDQVWLSKVTVVRVGEDGAFTFVGVQSPLQAGRFEVTRDKLKYFSVISPYEKSSANATLVNSWDIEHTDYHLAKVNGRTTNVEEENDEIEWYEKRYLRIDWENADVSEAASFPFMVDRDCWSAASSGLVEGTEEISKEYIGFTVAVDYQIDENCLNYRRYNKGSHTHTVHYKYSFIPRQSESSYQPYLYTGEFDPLFSKYGYFRTVVEGIGENGLYQNKFVMNRWNPQKTHVFYFADGFPQEYKRIYNDPQNGVTKRVNDIFSKHGLKTRFEIRENDGSKKFGDLRYSFIKFVDGVNQVAPLGYGPSDADPFTGEIIAANTVVWTGLLKYFVNVISERLDRQKTAFEESSVYQELKVDLGDQKKAWTESAESLTGASETGKYFSFLLPQYTYGIPGSAFARKESQPIFRLPSVESLLAEGGMSLGSDLMAEVDSALASAGTAIKEVETRRYDQLDTTRYGLSESLATARRFLQSGKSSDETIFEILYSTAIHEFGHNLNLRHNFYGSTDVAHFGKPEDQYTKSSSSVMDYMALEADEHVGWGIYDEAAIVYAYSNGAKDLAADNATTYLYCTDQHTVINAMCNRFDRGATPSKVALSLIEHYEDAYWTRNFRYDRAYWNTSGYAGSIFMTMWSLKKFLTMYQQTYETMDMTNKLAQVAGLSGEQIATFAGEIQSDLKQSALLSAAFFSSVIQQKQEDRSYTDFYDNWTGALEQKGITIDKLFASLFLLGDDSFVYNPNRSAEPTSYLPVREDDEVGAKIADIIKRSVIDPGDMALGYDFFNRLLYARTALNYRNLSGTGSSIEQIRITCFTPESLETRFNIADVFNFSQNGEAPRVLDYAIYPLDNLDVNADPYFRTGTSEVAIIAINGNYYVASKERNDFAFDLINKQIRYEVLEMHQLYYLLTEGRIPDCR